jgi:hypothetical protein
MHHLRRGVCRPTVENGHEGHVPRCVKKSSWKGSEPQVDGIVLIDASRAESSRHSRCKIVWIGSPKQANHRAGGQVRIILGTSDT